MGDYENFLTAMQQFRDDIKEELASLKQEVRETMRDASNYKVSIGVQEEKIRKLEECIQDISKRAHEYKLTSYGALLTGLIAVATSVLT